MRIRARRGSALGFTIVLSIILTGLVIALALQANGQTLQSSNTIKHDAVFYVAEAGAQRAYWKFKHNNTFRAPANAPLTGTMTINNAVYTYSATVIGIGMTVDIESSASITSINGSPITSPAVGATVGLSATYIAYVPALTIANSLDKKDHLQNLTINGDLQIQKDLGGDTRHLQVNGTIIYGGNMKDKKTHYTGSTRKEANTPPTINYNSMKSHANNGNKGTKATNGMVIDFTQYPGTNPVFYADGDLKNPVFIGSGTVISDGKIVFDKNGDVTIGDAANPVYLVAEEQIEFHNTHELITVYGGIYTQKDFKVESDIDIHGPVSVKGNLKFKGKKTDSTITAGPTPWFDPRVVPNAGTVEVGSFHGS